MLSILPLVRLITFGTASLFAFIVLVMCAHILHWTSQFPGAHADFAGLGVAVAVLTLVTLPVMLFIGHIRPGALPTFISVELGWIGFLWVMWLASGGTTANINMTGGRCGDGRSGASTICGEINAIEAFAFLNWLILMGYFLVLLVFSIRSLQSGNHQIWTTSVKDANFGGGSNSVFSYDKNTVQRPGITPRYPPTTA